MPLSFNPARFDGGLFVMCMRASAAFYPLALARDFHSKRSCGRKPARPYELP
jgi:hypothetical protein